METVAAPVEVKLIAPDCADPPGALIVVIVLLSTTLPLKVRTSPVLSKNRDSAFDPLGTDDGVPTPNMTSTSTLAPKLPPEVNLSIPGLPLSIDTTFNYDFPFEAPDGMLIDEILVDKGILMSICIKTKI